MEATVLIMGINEVTVDVVLKQKAHVVWEVIMKEILAALVKVQKVNIDQDMILVVVEAVDGTVEVAAVMEIDIQVVVVEVQVGHSPNQTSINGKKEILVNHLNMF